MTPMYISRCTGDVVRAHPQRRANDMTTASGPTLGRGIERIVSTPAQPSGESRENSMSLTLTTTSPANDTSLAGHAVAARAVDAVKVYGRADTEVRALD